MKLLTERDNILGIVEAWEKQYHARTSGSWAQEKLDALRKLDLASVTAEDVESIIGNSGWVSIRCEECECLVKSAVQLGEEVDYDHPMFVLCFDCLKKAQALEPESWLRG